MTIPDAAIEAAATAIRYQWSVVMAVPEEIARAAIEAAMPAIREAIAQEIEAQRIEGVWNEDYNTGIDAAAHAARGGTP